MDLLWNIKHYDWFELYSDDQKYWKDTQDKLSSIIMLIKKETNIKVLQVCLDEIPDKIGSKIKVEIQKRIYELNKG